MTCVCLAHRINRNADTGFQRKVVRLRTSSFCAVSGIGGGRKEILAREGAEAVPRRQPDYSRGQSPRAQGVASRVRGQGGLHLH